MRANQATFFAHAVKPREIGASVCLYIRSYVCASRDLKAEKKRIVILFVLLVRITQLTRNTNEAEFSQVRKKVFK